jgi:type I restriction enzyme M protein
MITKDEEGAICSNGFSVLRNVKGVDPFFLLAYMRTQYYLRQVRRLMTGHAIPAIAVDDLARVLVPVPPQEKQHEIAHRVEEIHRMVKASHEASGLVIQETESLLQ